MARFWWLTRNRRRGRPKAAALAGHGREAMCMSVDEALARNEEGRLPEVALAVLDMHAGSGRGVKLAERLVVANPELRIIFTLPDRPSCRSRRD